MNRSAKSARNRLFKLVILLGFVIIHSGSAFSQKFEIENKFHIKQDDKSIVFRVLDTDESRLKKYNPDKNYYWFKSQKVIITQGGSSGSLLNGEYESFYKNNQLAEKGLFRKGLKHGVWKFWNQSGILVHQENWSKGIQTGKQLYYSPKGIIQKTVVYKSNQVQIISRDTTILKTKKTVLTTIKDSTGKLLSQSRVSNFLLDGTQITRDQNDSLVKTVYKKGIPVTEKAKTKKEKSEVTEKRTFRQKMSGFWQKIQFWKKFKKKEGKAGKEKKSEEKPAEQPQKETSSETATPKEKKKRTK
jgi:antitoxin component YwqK of YwqJK toxin-antitoxin module